MSRQHHRKHRSKVRSLHIWHRYIGLTAAALVVILATTGLLLNHTREFSWDRKYVTSPWLLDWYGIKAPKPGSGFALGPQTLFLYGQHLYLDDLRLEGEYRQLQGALSNPDMILVAADQYLLLLTRTGELIDRLEAGAGLPGTVQRMGRDDRGQPLVMINDQVYQPDSDWLRWRVWAGQDTEIRWARTVASDAAQQQRMAAEFRNHILPMERVLLDLHSGRIFGRYGIWLMDFAALLLLLLAGSGIWMWYRRRR